MAFVNLLLLSAPAASLIQSPIVVRTFLRQRAHTVALTDASCDTEASWCTTSSGMRYVDDLIGDGDLPAPSQVVRVKYVGALLSDGRKVEFPNAKSPLVFEVEKGMPIWKEGIEGMRVGGRRKLLVPPSAKFKALPGKSSGDMERTETIRFELELVGIESGPTEMLARLSSRVPWRLTPGGALLLLSFLPYLLPEEVRPAFWRGGDQGFVNSFLTLGSPPPIDIDSLF